jgi:hypothetical protein
VSYPGFLPDADADATVRFFARRSAFHQRCLPRVSEPATPPFPLNPLRHGTANRK